MFRCIPVSRGNDPLYLNAFLEARISKHFTPDADDALVDEKRDCCVPLVHFLARLLNHDSILDASVLLARLSTSHTHFYIEPNDSRLM